MFKMAESAIPTSPYSYQHGFSNQINWFTQNVYVQPIVKKESFEVQSNMWTLPPSNGESWMSIFHRNWETTTIPMDTLHQTTTQPIIPQPEKKSFGESIKTFFKPIFDGIGKVVGFIKTVVKIISNVVSVISVTKHLFA
jgi:hypothetical protein